MIYPKHPIHVSHLTNIPFTNVLVKDMCFIKHPTHNAHDNMDSTLRGWAKLDTTAGETAIQSYVTWGIANYTDATARQYLIDTLYYEQVVLKLSENTRFQSINKLLIVFC
jgi:hypothetical protein